MFHLKVKKIDGEKVRKKLLKEKILDTNKKILKEGDFLFFPLIKNKIKIEDTEIVKKRSKTKRKRKSLRDLLKNKLTKEELNLLPKSFDIIGDILVLELDEKLEKKKKIIADSFLQMHKNLRVVLKKKSERETEFRTRKFEILAHKKNRTTETLHKEYSSIFKLDVRKVYFSPREANERQRIAKKVKSNEKILVMFSGIAPYAIQIAKSQPSAKITCIEKNSYAMGYANENIRLNRVQDKIKNILGDVKIISKKFIKENKKFDRILMPLPKGAYGFLDITIPLLKEKGILHFYHWAREEDLFSEAENLVEGAARKLNKKIKILERKKVLPYSPRTWKVVLDVELKRK